MSDHASRRASIVALISAGAARAATVPAAFPQDPVEYYGSRFLIGLLIVGAALLAYSLLRYRGRLDTAVGWVLVIAGVGVVPAAALLIGGVLMFGRAERVEFCGSCHLAMQAYVDDLRNPGSRSLAAVHYKNRYIPQNQCYVCHTSFGLFGTLQAKIAGVIDVQRYYTGTFHSPPRMREPYRNVECLKCHGEALRWMEQHRAVQAEVFGGTRECLECHGGAHPAHVLAGRRRS